MQKGAQLCSSYDWSFPSEKSMARTKDLEFNVVLQGS